MVKHPTVSVIISAFNAEKTIEKSVESITLQTYKNLEILVADDYSTDNTYEILMKMNSKDERIVVIKNKKNLGLTKSLNNLLNLASGNYIARHDADDISKETRIERQFNYLLEKKYDAVCCLAKIIGEERVIPNLSRFINPKYVMKIKNPFIHGTLLIKKEVIESVGSYDEKFIFSQDYKLFKDLFAKGYKIKNLNEVLYLLNTKNNISTKFKNEQEYFADCVRKNLIP
tara:strand:+ start:204 stop:890 length:687 start_codon:yes stop_codon:yes gene_type:complete